MSSIEQQIATQIANVEKSTGRSLAEWTSVINSADFEKHGQIVAWLKSEQGMTHGNANMLAMKAREVAAGGARGDADLVESHYAGKHAALRPLYDQVVNTATGLGSDVEFAPKKTYVSLRRKKQFATVGPAAGQLEVCLNLPGHSPTDRLRPTTGMATHKVRVSGAAELDEELLTWMREAYDRAG